MTGKFVWPELPAALHEGQPWSRPGIEPPEVLADPIVQAVMRRDGVTPSALKSVIAGAQHRLRKCRRPASPLTHDQNELRRPLRP
jgi:hypothetical protein